ncbi:MAG: glycoside hydrolase family 3 N-terminal domain-containing protein [archaeon]
MENKMSILVALIIITLILTLILIYLAQYSIILNKIQKLKTGNINLENNTIDFDSLTLRQKIAQMFIVRGNLFKEEFENLNIGGIYLNKGKSIEDYKKLISKWQNQSRIKLFVSTDLEGWWSPFSKEFPEEYQFPPFSEIKNEKQAYAVGLDHGEILKKVGFNLNFAPVAEFKDEVYGGRTFQGSEQEIKDKLSSYIKGLQKNVMGVCKHYPGRGMIKNTHKRSDKQEIFKKDLELFETCFENNVSAIMIGHQIATGEIDSKGHPSSVSTEVIDKLENFKGLIISDDVAMRGITIFYNRKSDMYKDLINSGENIIITSIKSPVTAYKIISKIEEEVKRGKISEEKINKSVKKILISKGYKIKN